MDESNNEVDAGLMDVARVQLRSTIDEAREAIWNLRQPDRDATQLGENLRGMAEQVSEEFHIPVACAITGMPFAVSHPIAHDLLMVAREAVYNSTLHGQPSRVEVALTYSNRELVLSLSDDGCGFDPQGADDQDGRHFGLRGMRERIERSGGQFRLTSAVGRGVRIEVRMPRSRARASALHEVN